MVPAPVLVSGNNYEPATNVPTNQQIEITTNLPVYVENNEFLPVFKGTIGGVPAQDNTITWKQNTTDPTKWAGEHTPALDQNTTYLLMSVGTVTIKDLKDK